MSTNQKSWEDLIRDNLQLGLLVVAAFVIGYLFSEIKNLKGGPATAGSNTNTQIEANTNNNNPQQPTVTLASIIEKSGADTSKVMKCLNDGQFADKVNEQTQNGSKAGVNGTPGNFILLANGQGEAIAGALPFEQLKPVLDAYLKDGKSANTVALSNLQAVSDSDHIRGSNNAKITVVEYSDYDCPFCSRFHTTMQQVLSEYEGDVRWVYRHYPIPQLHPNANKMSQASECIADQNGEEAFWKFSDAYYEAKASGATVTL